MARHTHHKPGSGRGGSGGGLQDGTSPAPTATTPAATGPAAGTAPQPPSAARTLQNGSNGRRAGRESLIDLSSYPILTQDVSTVGPTAPAPSGGPDTALGRTVSNTIAGVLGWRPKAGDTRGFLAALEGAFTLRDVEGHVEWTYNQRSYAAQADLGTITGAQASIYARAKAAMDQAIPLLQGLTPLRPDYDEVDCESIRSIILTELTDIPVALSVAGGPIVQRVNQLFELLGWAPSADTLEGLTGQMQVLRDRFGMARQWVNTVDQEQNLTNFIILVDYVTTLRSSWQQQRKFFGNGQGSGQPYLGTQLVLLSRQLGVITESVDELRYVLDSVFVPQAERETVQVTFPYAATDNGAGDGAPMYLEDLLKWIEDTAAEGRNTIQDSGKDGVMTFAKNVKLLHKLIAGLLADCTTPRTRRDRDLPDAFGTPRVIRAIRELHDQLDVAYQLAREVNRNADPVVTVIMPPTGSGQTLLYTVVLFGTGFQFGATVGLTGVADEVDKAGTADVDDAADDVTDGPTAVGVPTVHNPTTLSFTVPVSDVTAAPRWTLTVKNPDGGEWVSARGELVFAPAPDQS